MWEFMMIGVEFFGGGGIFPRRAANCRAPRVVLGGYDFFTDGA
jgi:hypothetical protein